MSETGFDRRALREARERAGLTREQLADDIGRGYSTLAAWENGPGYPPIAALNLIARVLGVRVVDLLEDQMSA
jgi:transcriptional regulator with XRE-family HTH domain